MAAAKKKKALVEGVKTFPRTLYVRIENAGKGDDEYFEGKRSFGDFETGGLVAIYELSQVKALVQSSELIDPKGGDSK